MQMPSKVKRSATIGFFFVVTLALTLSSVLLHAGTRPAARRSAVATGTWGGQHIILEVSDKGADVEFDCGHGQITQPITTDPRGHFDVAGTYSAEHGGPVRRDEETTAAPARYSGRATGDTMELTITRGEEKIGVYTLTRGSRPMLTKCR
jgi:hypothetical protein